MKTATDKYRRQRGSQLVEFAIVLPFLVFLVLIVTEGAGMIRMHQVLNNAAREGARLSSLQANRYPPTGAEVVCDAACVENSLKNAVINYASNNGVTGVGTGEIEVIQNCQIPIGGGLCSPGADAAGYFSASRIIINHPYQFRFMPTVKWMHMSDTVTLQARAVFRNLY